MMKIKTKFVGIAFVVVLAITSGLSGLTAIVLMSSIPDANGEGQINGLSEPVRVLYDRHAVAHIEADSLLDAVAAQGYAHAQQRLWQMELFRLTGQGRLAEVFGEAMIDADVLLRSFNFTEHSQASYAGLQAGTKAILQAYSKGVNAYLQRKRGFIEASLPPEFLILRHTPEPWQPWHSLLTLRVMDLTLGANMRQEIDRLALSARGLTPDEIDDIVRYADIDQPPPLPDLRELYRLPDKAMKAGLTEQTTSQLYTAVQGSGFDLPWHTGVTASNNWVIGGSRTQSGMALLANDPHLGLTSPSIWYLNHLAWQENGKPRHLIGASIPSMPMIVLGRNKHIAWGFTASNLDAQDIYLEKLNPDHPDEYLTQQGWQKFDQRTVTIKVAKQQSVDFTLRSTRHGPVLPAKYRDLHAILPKGYVAALQWTALNDHDTTFDALCQFPLARSVAQFKQALLPLISPMQTIVVADREGHIGKFDPGHIPVRDQANLIMGRAPVPGWLPQYDWKGFVAKKDWPSESDPDNAMLFSANYKFVKADYPHHITFDWERSYRHRRIQQLIENQIGKHSVDTMAAMLADDYSEALSQLRTVVLALLPEHSAIDSAVLSALRHWDGHMRKDTPEPLIMMAWFKRLGEVLLHDDLQQDYDRIAGALNIEIIINTLKGKIARDWCDDVTTTEHETCAAQVEMSWMSVVKALRQDYGRDWHSWRWGAAHLAYNQHRPFAHVPVLANMFNVEEPSSGGPYTLLRGMTHLNEAPAFYNRAASTYRAIYDFADLENSLFIQNTGQSGHFLSAHYRDYAKRWAKVDFIPMWTDKSQYANEAIGIWHLSAEE